MANPNKVKEGIRKKWALVYEESFHTSWGAESDKERLKGQYERITIRSYKLGSRKAPVTMYMVRGYNKKS